LKFLLVIGVLTTITRAECPITVNPTRIVECLRYLTSGLYGAVMQGVYHNKFCGKIDCFETLFFQIFVLDLKIICSIASDIANCVERELGDCMAAEVDTFFRLVMFSFMTILGW
jgi:hypothetical protein